MTMILRALPLLICSAAPLWAIEIAPPVSLCDVAEDLRADVKRYAGYDLQGGCPAIRYSLPRQDGPARQVQVGSFNLHTAEIGLAVDLDLTSAFGRSILLHELVHLAQHQSGRRWHCPEAREYEAYAAQAAYLRAHGLTREAAFATISAAMVRGCPGDEY